MLLDTSGLLCYFDRAEHRHAQAVEQFQRAPVRLTHSYVLAEFLPLCHVRRLRRQSTLMFMAELVDSPLVDVVWVDQALHTSALALLRDRPDKAYSLCDAVSFVLMRQRGMAQALTTDRHFEQEGFTKLLPA